MRYVCTSVRNPKVISANKDALKDALNQHMDEVAAEGWQLTSTLTGGSGQLSEVLLFWQKP